MVAIANRQRARIFEAVQAMYTDVATCPSKVFHFPTGRAACILVGYPEGQLDSIPATALESFAGVGYPFAADVVRPGHHVLDVGSGSGTDALLGARMVGAEGHVYGLDVTESMRVKFVENAASAGVRNVTALAGDAEQIALPDASIDVVTTNGVLNLVPDKQRALSEIFRVLRPGGFLQLSDIVLSRPVSESSRENPDLWAECIVGAVREDDYVTLLQDVGFVGVTRLRHLDYFAASSNASTRKVAASLGARSVVLRVVKGSSR
jgi:SAM-dependent methyltransferase